jgi:hypothetical protein
MIASRSLAASFTLVAALASTPALAGGDSGFYLGAGAGQSYVDVEGYAGFDGDDSGWKLIGGYGSGTTFVDAAVELEYVDFGKPEDGGAEVDASALAVFGLGGVNLGPIGLFGKVGVFGWDADLSAGPISGSDDGVDVAYGAGLRFRIASFQVRGEYELFSTDTGDLALLSASLLYTF